MRALFDYLESRDAQQCVARSDIEPLPAYLVHTIRNADDLRCEYEYLEQHELMWGMEIGERLAEKRMRDTADLRKDIRLISERHLRYIVGRQV